VPPWKLKAGLQRAFSVLPAGDRVNYLFQKHVTRTYPMSDEHLREAVTIGLDHVRGLNDTFGRGLTKARFFEFGAGWDLHMPLVLWALGIEHQVVVDIRPLARADLVADVVRRLAGRAQVGAFVRLPPTPPAGDFDLRAYLQSLGIDYRAPSDARATGLRPGSIDVVTSTNTMEHIPQAELPAILAELCRILADDGLMSFRIDYQDHYAYFDRSISVYNFLTLNDRSWRRWNPSLHFQNRMRHREHLAVLDEAGFAVLADELRAGDASDLDILRKLPLAPQFTTVPLEELAVRSARLVLAKKSAVR